MKTITLETGELAYEHDGLLWKPLPGCTSTFDDRVRAHDRWLEIFHETQWNPWRTDELTPEADQAYAVMKQWTRAEPDHRMMTDQEVKGWMAEMDREFDARHASDGARWQRDKQRYSPERETARYALLERQSLRARLERDLEGYRSGARFPGMPANQRAANITELESEIGTNAQEMQQLSIVVGDADDVVDESGRLPSDRRPLNLVGYDVYRRFKVEELRTAVAAQQQERAEAEGRKEKAALERRLAPLEQRLETLLAVPRLSADEMCSECDTPLDQHVPGTPNGGYIPCPCWPMHAARMKQVRANLQAVPDSIEAGNRAPQPPEPSRPVPLATLPGSLPIAEVIERLGALQAQHPTAIVRRGRVKSAGVVYGRLWSFVVCLLCGEFGERGGWGRLLGFGLADAVGGGEGV